MDTAIRIDTGDVIFTAHIDLLAFAFLQYPLIPLSPEGLICFVDYPDGAVSTDRGPHCFTRELNPLPLLPLKNLLLRINTNIFV